MNTHVLSGLNAQNPLGYFAALGLLRVLDVHARAEKLPRPMLGFPDGDTIAALTSTMLLDEIISFVLKDAALQKGAAFLQIAYDDKGELVDALHENAKQDLKPSPAAARDILLRAAIHGTRRDQDLLVGLFSELVTDNNNNTKPTSFHFTAGTQAFVSMAEDLRAGITADDVREALLGPWTSESTLPSMSWDASVSRQYALRATSPSSDKKGSEAAANWLGVQALAFFPVQAARDRLVTTGVRGGWKDSVFSWPVWAQQLTQPTIASLIRCSEAKPDGGRRWTARERAALGISAVFSSKISRTDHGGYGSFSPAEVVIARANG
jgi:hypothetical protein